MPATFGADDARRGAEAGAVRAGAGAEDVRPEDLAPDVPPLAAVVEVAMVEAKHLVRERSELAPPRSEELAGLADAIGLDAEREEVGERLALLVRPGSRRGFGGKIGEAMLASLLALGAGPAEEEQGMLGLEAAAAPADHALGAEPRFLRGRGGSAPVAARGTRLAEPHDGLRG